MPYSAVGSAYEYETSGSTINQTPDIPDDARMAVATFVLESTSSEAVSSGTLNGKSFVLCNDGDIDAKTAFNDAYAETWFVNLEEDDEGLGQTLTVNLTGSSHERCRMFLRFFDAQGTVVDVQVFGANRSDTNFAPVDYTTDALVITNLGSTYQFLSDTFSWDDTTGSHNEYAQSPAPNGTAAAVSAEQFFTTGTSVTPDASWASARDVVGVAVSFTEPASLVAPSTPTDPRVTGILNETGLGENTFSFGHDEDFSSFIIRTDGGSSGSNYGPAGSVTAPNRTFVHKGLDPTLTYRYIVHALGDGVNHANDVSAGTTFVSAQPTSDIPVRVVGFGYIEGSSPTSLAVPNLVLSASDRALLYFVGIKNNNGIPGTVASATWNPGSSEGLALFTAVQSQHATNPLVGSAFFDRLAPTPGTGTATVFISGQATNISLWVLAIGADVVRSNSGSAFSPGTVSSTTHAAIANLDNSICIQGVALNGFVNGLVLEGGGVTASLLGMNPNSTAPATWVGAKDLPTAGSYAPVNRWNDAFQRQPAALGVVYQEATPVSDPFVPSVIPFI